MFHKSSNDGACPDMPFDQVLVLQIAYIGDLLLAPYRPSVIHVDLTTLACRLPSQIMS